MDKFVDCAVETNYENAAYTKNQAETCGEVAFEIRDRTFAFIDEHGFYHQ